MTTNTDTVSDQAGLIYNLCADEAVVAPAGNSTWNVHDGFGGDVVATVSNAVLEDLENNYDMPVLLEDGSYWTPDA